MNLRGTIIHHQIYIDMSGKIFNVRVLPFDSSRENPKLTRGTKYSVGYDIYSMEDYTLEPGEIHLFSTNILLDMPENIEAQVRSRSSLARSGVIVMNSPGTIDPDYSGEVKVLLGNMSPHGNARYIYKGDKIAQLVFQEIPEVRVFRVFSGDSLITSDEIRGEGGFGSTGK